MKALSTIACFAAAGMLIVGTRCAAADLVYPSKPIRFIVPYAAGGGTDTVVRVLGPGRAPRVLGHQFPGSAATKGGYLT